MTRCKHCSYNYQLKSSAYNQTGQSYELQLAAYNAMTNHLRRVLLAKSVVDSGRIDSRFSNRAKTSRRAKTPVCSKRYGNAVRESPSQNLIDRLAYDTKHHPHEVASMSWGSGKYNGSKKTIRSNSTDSSEEYNSRRDHRDLLKSHRDKFQGESSERNAEARSSQSRQRARGSSGGRKKHRNDFEDPEDDSGESEEFADGKKFEKCDRERQRHKEKRFPCVRSSLEISCPGTPEFMASSSTFCSDVSMYVKFVYDITREVMDRGFYSDQQIEGVFEKHFERNLGRLNKNKMLREINSLKKALNINYDSEDGEEDQDKALTVACGFSPSSNKHSLLKLSTLKERTKTIEKNHPPREIVVTKEDILTTLLEMDLNPDKAQEICTSLENRSREVNPYQDIRLSTADEEEETVGSSGSRNIRLSVSKGEDSNVKSNPLPGCESKSSKEEIRGSYEKIEEGDGGNGSEKDKIEGIGMNLDTEESTEALKERFSISNQNLIKRDSPTGEKSPVSSVGSGINKVEAESRDLSNGKVEESDETANLQGNPIISASLTKKTVTLDLGKDNETSGLKEADI